MYFFSNLRELLAILFLLHESDADSFQYTYCKYLLIISLLIGNDILSILHSKFPSVVIPWWKLTLTIHEYSQLYVYFASSL